MEIQPEMIAHVDRRVNAAGLTNVETHVASAHQLPLDDRTVDRAFLKIGQGVPVRVRAVFDRFVRAHIHRAGHDACGHRISP